MNANKNLGASLLVCAVLASPAAFAATYDFTGTVTGTSGTYGSIADGTTVTGTYTFNVANGVPGQSVLPVSATSEWYSREYSGTVYGIPSNSAYVFSSTAHVGTVSYQTSAVPGAYYSYNLVLGYPGYYEGVEDQSPNGSSVTESEFYLTNSSGNPYSIAGLPVFSGATTGNGFFSDSGQGEVAYNITSLTAVPLPASAWLLLSALGGLGLLARRHQAECTGVGSGFI